jgi:hypothetical protein
VISRFFDPVYEQQLTGDDGRRRCFAAALTTTSNNTSMTSGGGPAIVGSGSGDGGGGSDPFRSSSPSRIMVGGEDSSFLRPIPEDDDDEDRSSSVSNRLNSNLKSKKNPHQPTSTNLSLLDSTTAPYKFALPVVGPSGNQHNEVSSDDARSSTKGIIVDPRRPDLGNGVASNESVVGTDRAEVAYANDDAHAASNSGGQNPSTSFYPAPAPGYRAAAGARGGRQVPEQRRHPSSSSQQQPGGIRHSLLRRHSQVSEKWHGLSRRNQWIVAGSVILTVLVAVAIVLVIVFTTTNAAGGGGGSSSGGGTAPSQAPTPLNTISDSTASYIDGLLDNVSSPQAFEDPTSPQSRARVWIYNDLLLNDLISEGADRVVQRYVCVELVYALGIPNATLRSDVAECEWSGFSCDEELPGHIITNISFPSLGLTGSLPEELAQLQYLQRLELHDNNITGPIPVVWMSNSTPMQNLYRLDLSDNRLTGSLPDYFWTSFPPLSYVYLNDNLLSGPLVEPAGSSPLILVEEVWLQRNRFNGPLPAAWMMRRFPNAEKLKLGDNELTGTLPTLVTSGDAVGNGDVVVWPANITHFDVSMNLLQGTIPASLYYTFPKIQSLYLHTNAFTGSLPTGTGAGGATAVGSSSAAMQKILLHSNLLTGTIPSDFGASWPDLQIITIHNNSLTGSFTPLGLCAAWPFIEEVWADCPFQVNCTCGACNCSSAA